MPSKFRLFAGPNGSGKTFLFNFLKENNYIHTEIYISADRIEKTLKDKMSFNFNAYRISTTEIEFKEYIKKSSLYKKVPADLMNDFNIEKGVLLFTKNKTAINSYHAAFIAQYLVDKLFETKQSFCFESVISHPSKIDIVQKAKEYGYESYLYFIYTEDVDLNILRVKLRTQYGMHDVPVEKIKSRFLKSFKVMKEILNVVDNAYIINNSNEMKIVLQKKDNKILPHLPFQGIIKKYLA